MEMRRKIRRSLLQAVSWWLDGLRLPLPVRIRYKVLPIKEPFLIHYKDGLFHGAQNVGMQDGNIIKEGGFRDLPSLLHEYAVYMEQHCQYPVLCLDNEDILVKRLQLPRSTRKELSSLVDFELQRILPFPVSGIRYDFVISDITNDHTRISVSVVIVPLDRIQNLLAHISQSGREIPVMVLTEDNRFHIDPNMSPGIRPYTPYYLPFGWRYAVALLSAVAFFLAFPLLFHEIQLRNLNTSLSENRKTAVDLNSKLTELAARSSKSDFLATRTSSYFSPLNVLRALTDAMPQDTWLQSLTISKNKMQIHGESPSAANTLALIEDSSFLAKANFLTPVAPSEDGEKEEFQIIADLEDQNGR